MKRFLKIPRLLIFLLVISAAYCLQACQEFIHNSFDTIVGTIVDQEGNPVSNSQLNLYTSFIDAASYAEIREEPFLQTTTNAEGQFKVVVPSKKIDDFYFLVLPSNLLFAVDQFGTIEHRVAFDFYTSVRDSNGIVDLGTLTVVAP